MLRKEARKKKPMVANADKIDAEGLESCYPAIIQSGVKFNLKPSAVRCGARRRRRRGRGSARIPYRTSRRLGCWPACTTATRSGWRRA